MSKAKKLKNTKKENENKKNETKKIVNTKDKNDNSFLFKRLIIFIFTFLGIFLAFYISSHPFREFIDTNILKREVKENSLKEIYEEVNAKNVFLSNKNIHILTSGELKTYDKNGNFLSSNILSIGNAVCDHIGDYMVLGEKDGRKVFLFEKGKLKWEREIEGNIDNVYINKNGKICVIGKTSIYNSLIVLMDENGNSSLKRYFKSKYISKAGISGNDKFLVMALVDYEKIKILSEIEIMDIEKAANDEEGAIIKKYEKDELILDIDVQDTEETLVKCLKEIYLVNKDEEKKVHDISDETSFVTIKLNGGFAEVNQIKTNIFKAENELKFYDKYGNNAGVLLLDDNIPKDVIGAGSNVLIEMQQQVIVSSDIGWLKKRYNSKRNIIDVKISEEMIAIIYNDQISIVSI